MWRKMAVKIRIWRVISYVLLLLCVGFLYYFFHSYMMGIVGIVLLLLPVMSVGGLVGLHHVCRIGIAAGTESVEKGDYVCAEFCIHNPWWLCGLEAEVTAVVENIFYGEREELRMAMPIHMHSTSACRLPFRARRIGTYRIEVKDWHMQDLVGLVRLEGVKVAGALQVDVFPSRGVHEPEQAQAFASAANEVEESKNRGSDFAEVSEIREYVTGDRLRDIHWKLSAKRDTWMVKERVSMSGTELVFVPKLDADIIKAEAIMEELYALCTELAGQHILLRILIWNRTWYGWEEYVCQTAHDVTESYRQIYQAPVSDRCSDSNEVFLGNDYPNLRSYLSVECAGDGVQVELRYNE